MRTKKLHNPPTTPPQKKHFPSPPLPSTILPPKPFSLPPSLLIKNIHPFIHLPGYLLSVGEGLEDVEALLDGHRAPRRRVLRRHHHAVRAVAEPPGVWKGVGLVDGIESATMAGGVGGMGDGWIMDERPQRPIPQQTNKHRGRKKSSSKSSSATPHSPRDPISQTQTQTPPPPPTHTKTKK